MIVPRGWQADAIESFMLKTGGCFLLDATPGSGKTIFSALCFKRLAEAGTANNILIVVPTTALKGDADGGFLGDYNRAGIHISTNLRAGIGLPHGYQGGAITYNQLPTIIRTLETWTRNGSRLFVVFDEVHHLTDVNTWGSLGEQLADCAVRVLAMTGTPFRGDGKRISFIQYDANKKSIADHRYSYAQAVADGICRPVQFMTEDGVAEFVQDDDRSEVRLSEADDDDDVRNASKTIFRADSQWLETVIKRVDQELDDYRRVYPTAGCLIVCRPGTDDADQRHLRQVASMVKRITGHKPIVVSHDDDNANSEIERFRRSTDKYICAVRMVSEGVDIKRLHVVVMATNPTTELLFRQIVGRCVRVQDESAHEHATVFIPKFPRLLKYASRIRAEAEAGLHERVPRGPRESGEESVSSFTALGSYYESGGAISDDGDQFSSTEISRAEKLKRSLQLHGFASTQVARLVREVESNRVDEEINLTEAVGEPLQVQKQKKRDEINALVKARAGKIGREKNNKPDFDKVYTDLFRAMGVRDLNDLMDNYPIDKMSRAIEVLKSWIGGAHVTA